jgi:HD-like signal output (HDOD) protein
MSRQGGVAALSLAHFTLDRDLTGILPREVVVQHFVLPIDRLGRLLTVAMVCPMDMEAIAAIQQATRLRVKPMLCTYDDFFDVVQKYYGVSINPPTLVEKGASVSMTVSLPSSFAEERASEQFAAAVNMALMERVDKVDRLEIGADVPARVAALVGGGDESLVKLVSVLGGSPPLAATALWTTNTAAYGIPEGVDSLPMAVVLLGDQGINLLASNARRMSPAMDERLMVLTKHARRVGEAAGLLASVTGRAIPNVAQCAGALYPIGSFVLALLDPAEYMKIDPLLVGRARAEAERKVFGAGHDEVGGRLLGRWRIATSLFEAVRCYTDPYEAGDRHDIAAIVQVAVASITAEGALDSDGLKGAAEAMESLELDAAGVESALAQLKG